MNPIRYKSLTVAVIGGTALAVSTLGLPSQAATGGGSSGHASVKESASRSPGYVDARQLSGRTLSQATNQQVDSLTKADQAYYDSLGTQAIVSLDPLTHTVREIGKLNGYLTGRSTAPARSVALSYVRSHMSTLGLHKGDLKTLVFRRDYVDPSGLHNLSWTQEAAGRSVFGNGLIVRVTRDGRVLAVQGSPVSGLTALAAKAPATGTVSAPQARALAAHNVDAQLPHTAIASSRGGASATTKWSNSDQAARVWFLTAQGLRPGWSTYVQTSKGAYQHVIDSATGRTLYRHSNTDSDNGDAFVYDNFPGAAKGGKARVVNFLKRGWLTRSDTFLKGDSVTAFSDVNDDNALQNSEKTPVPGTRHGAQFKLKKFGAAASGFCKKFVCTWNPNVTGSWKDNRKEATTNGFYFASNFHDYLAKAPISFTPAAGNFSAKGGDPVMLNTLDGADTGTGPNAHMPDGNHIDNANMSTPPDGISPTMQMYLFHFPHTSDDPVTGDPFVPTTGSLDASVEYHEYTHGLSNRLVVDANGNSTLNDIQAGAMGEAWSDYYAMDYLVAKGFLRDTKKPGQLLEGSYVAAGQHLIRTMSIDCPVHATSKGCISGFDQTVKGGYTYADFPTIVGEPEVHGSGEIWGQTLWDLRTALGRTVADTLITRAMSLSADDPDFLDMRNAILQADLVSYNASHQNTIWRVFANRGMGYFAGSLDSADTDPAADFHPLPIHNPHDGTIAGFVTDPESGDPVQDATVTVAGQSFSTTTGPDGFYEMDNLVTGTYQKIVVTAPGYLREDHAGAAVSFGDFTVGDLTNFDVHRDWAAVSGRAEVVDFDGPDFTAFGCGPIGAFDLSLSTGWGSETGHEDADGNTIPTNVFEPKAITVKLPAPVDVDSLQVDPNATCGDDATASTGDYEVETSPDGTTFVEAAEGTFTDADRGRLNTVTLDPGTGDGVRYVRFTIKGNQTPDFATSCPDGPFSGCAFTDLTELAVIGTEAP